MTYPFPDLPYAYDALAPHIDEATMRIHHQRHHKTYYDKFVAAIEETARNGESLEALFAEISTLPAAIRNNGGGYYNHLVYWQSMTPNPKGAPEGPLYDAIVATYGSLDAFKEAFSQAAIGQFGSGFAWLVVKEDGQLAITSTPNQDNPLMDVAEVKGEPLLGCDVWEHAYYLSYQNKRPDYVNAWWQVVNWDFAEKVYQKALETIS
ncbi:MULTISPECIES: superoxide dismutase [unclassified Salinivibrio]|uniref:superoxide dismutase n=1 Tax=unclassified Salinivibrio TaxID=2636825 RepID=UPI00128C15EA|nr:MULTISPECIES: superoxide dismutase [unclassified Salinivibrio]MPS32116.1 superoxide dismutase [Salinivibrio sp. VYel7]MPX91956.1 superoxide dismutase [Salinivibrio sp. VYel1]MPX93510.1 superoxide dismutase [Salinivibrio sp. VYel9]MPX96342.1 superoxide dismutase [Salinivibrio sp. VYel6]MPY00007.1 superoxide dismutase [Salinivibrio sp. VYel4]